MGGAFTDGYLMEGSRVFVALPADSRLVGLTGEFRRSHAALKVRWVPSANLHLTMVPPWECSDVDAVCKVLKEVSSEIPPFDAVFDCVSFGPDQRRPRLVWATGKAPEGMVASAHMLHGALGRSQEPGRSFLLHLTIARFNFSDFNSMRIRKLCEPVSWCGVFDLLCLYESMLKPGGAEYRELCRFSLTGGGLAGG